MSKSKVFPRPERVHGNSISNMKKNRHSSKNLGRSYDESIEDPELCMCIGGDSSELLDRKVSPAQGSGTGCLSRKWSISAWSCAAAQDRWIFGKVLDPQTTGMRRWNRLFLLSCALGVAVDPLFLSVFSINKNLSCLYVQKGNLIALTTLRGLVDFGYLVQIWLQLKTAYVSKESLVLGRGELIWDPRKIAQHYLGPPSGFIFDVYIILPVPQIMLWVVTPMLIAHGGDPTRVMTFIFFTFLIQYLPKVVHSALMVRRLQHVTGYVFGTASSGFFLNLITYFIAAHVSGWVFLVPPHSAARGVMSQRQCKAMENCPSTNFGCPLPIAYHHQPDVSLRLAWAQNSTVQSCLNASASDFSFGIYSWAVPLVTDGQCVNKILYPLFWGVMTFSSFGNALVPSNNVYEVLYSIVVITCGLLLFTLLIGNIQVFLQSITAKKAEMQIRNRDLEWWMRRRQLPTKLRLRVRQQERHRWAATRGIDEEALVGDLPEGLRRDIKRHLCIDLLKKVPLFEQLDELILNNICDRLKPVLFSKEEPIILEGNPIRHMLFMVRGSVLTKYPLHNNGMSKCTLGPGDFYGDELISWCLEKSEGRLPLSSATLTTLEMTEAFVLKAHDLKYITDHFRHKVVNKQLTRTTRYYSSTWRMWAAVAIQLAWRRFKARRSSNFSGPLNFARVSVPKEGDCNLDTDQQDRLRMYTAMITCPKPKTS